MVIVILNGNIIYNIISNNIGATTALCVHGSGAWTGRNLILDEGLAGWRSGVEITCKSITRN